MTKILRGTVRGRTIELDEDLGVPEGQEVEVAVRLVGPKQSAPSGTSDGLDEIYKILGERFDSGHSDTAERHNEHQP